VDGLLNVSACSYVYSVILTNMTEKLGCAVQHLSFARQQN